MQLFELAVTDTTACGSYLELTLDGTKEVQALKINTQASGWEEIDAVEICGVQTPPTGRRLTAALDVLCPSRCPSGQHYQPAQGRCVYSSPGDVTCSCTEYENYNACLQCPDGTWMGDGSHRGTGAYCIPLAISQVYVDDGSDASLPPYCHAHTDMELGSVAPQLQLRLNNGGNTGPCSPDKPCLCATGSSASPALCTDDMFACKASRRGVTRTLAREAPPTAQAVGRKICTTAARCPAGSAPRTSRS